MDYQEIYNHWLNSEKLTKAENKELKSIADIDHEIKERFSVNLEFGTAGMRGLIGLGTNRMNRFMVMWATFALGKTLCNQGEKAKNRGVVISYDTRNFSKEFAMVSAQVLADLGIKVRLFSECRPVPVLSHAVTYYKAMFGIMITASHNPKEYNGYKVYGENGAQLGIDATNEIIKNMQSVETPLSIPLSPETSPNITFVLDEIDTSFENAILDNVISKKEVKDFGKNIKIIYTPIHGSGLKPITTIFQKLGINYSLVNEQAEYDGDFSTVQVPNPETEDALAKAISLAKSEEADVVFGTDPDCDRIGVAIRNEENNSFLQLTGNQVGVLLLDYILMRLKETKHLPKNGLVVKSIVTTEMAQAICDYYGVKLENVLVGFKFIGEKIFENKKSKQQTYIFGFEESCGYLYGTHSLDKDAVSAAVLLAEMLCYYQSNHLSIYKQLNNLYSKFGFYKDSNISISFPGLDGMKKMRDIMTSLRNTEISAIGDIEVYQTNDYFTSIAKMIDGSQSAIQLPKSDILHYSLRGGSRVILRPSGTEPKLKVYISVRSENEKTATIIEKRIKENIHSLLNS